MRLWQRETVSAVYDVSVSLSMDISLTRMFVVSYRLFWLYWVQKPSERLADVSLRQTARPWCVTRNLIRLSSSVVYAL